MGVESPTAPWQMVADGTAWFSAPPCLSCASRGRLLDHRKCSDPALDPHETERGDGETRTGRDGGGSGSWLGAFRPVILHFRRGPGGRREADHLQPRRAVGKGSGDFGKDSVAAFHMGLRRAIAICVQLGWKEVCRLWPALRVDLGPISRRPYWPFHGESNGRERVYRCRLAAL